MDSIKEKNYYQELLQKYSFFKKEGPTLKEIKKKERKIILGFMMGIFFYSQWTGAISFENSSKKFQEKTVSALIWNDNVMLENQSVKDINKNLWQFANQENLTIDNINLLINELEYKPKNIHDYIPQELVSMLINKARKSNDWIYQTQLQNLKNQYFIINHSSILESAFNYSENQKNHDFFDKDRIILKENHQKIEKKIEELTNKLKLPEIINLP